MDLDDDARIDRRHARRGGGRRHWCEHVLLRPHSLPRRNHSVHEHSDELARPPTTNVAEGSNLYYLDSRVQSFVHASSTIPKTYSSNTFSSSNIFNGTLTFGASTALSSQANAGVVSATTSIGVLYGGTGATSLTGLLQGNGTSAMTRPSPALQDNSPTSMGRTRYSRPRRSLSQQRAMWELARQAPETS